MDFKDCVLQYCGYKNIAISSFEKMAHLSNGYVRNLKRRPSPNKIEGIAKGFPDLNTDWLLTGEGEMLIGDNAPAIQSNVGVPFFDLDVTASITETFLDLPNNEQFRIDFPPLNDCTAAFPVFGESMEPDFFAGEVIMVKEIKNYEAMLWGEPYLVITSAECDNLRTLKNVYQSPDKASFILRASNPRYQGDTVVAIKNVLKIFIVKGKISRRQL